MKSLAMRRVSLAACTLLAVSLSIPSCGGQGGALYNELYLTAGQIAVEEHESAYDILTRHRRLIVTGDVIGFKGGDDRDGFDVNNYSIPLLVVNGDPFIRNTTQVLRLIPADDVRSIRLYYASQVPPKYRRSGAEGGIIELVTISGRRPPG